MTQPKRLQNDPLASQEPREKARISKRIGRPRSTEVHRKILVAALAIANRFDYPDISIEKVAREAKVAKTTIYRWWKSKAELILEATSTHPLRIPDTGTLRGDLSSLLSQYANSHLQNAGRRVELGLWADLTRTHQDPQLQNIHRAYLLHEKAVVQEVLNQALLNGDLATPQDSDLALALIKGLPRHLRLVLGVGQAKISNDYLVDRILAGLRG